MKEIKEVRIINDYSIDIDKEKVDQIKNFDGIKEVVEEYEVFYNNNFENDDLLELCIEYEIDYASYAKILDIIEIIFKDGSKHCIDNLDIGYMFEKHYYESLSASWYKNYLCITITTDSGQYGLVAIWDSKINDWIYVSKTDYVYELIYYPDVDLFLALYKIGVWGRIGIGLLIIVPDSFKEVAISLYNYYDDSYLQLLGLKENEVINEEFLVNKQDYVDIDFGLTYDIDEKVFFVNTFGLNGKPLLFMIKAEDVIAISQKSESENNSI